MALEDVGLSVQLTAELDRFQQNMRDAGRVVEATTGTMDRATKRAADSFVRLEGTLDPAAKALQRYERDVLKAVVAVDKKAVSDTRGANVIKLLSDQYERSIAKINGSKAAMEGATVASNTFAQASTRGQNSSRQMGTAIQQAGYQVGDFAVQVASGQGVLRPFIQQGTQLVSMFGPWGAVIGAAGATIGAFATAMLNSGDAAGKNKDALELLDEATKALDDTTKSANESARQSALFKLRSAEAAEALTRSEIAAAEAIISRKQAELDATNISGSVLGVNPMAEILSLQLDAAKNKLEDYRGKLDELRPSIQKLRNDLAGLGSDYSRQADDNDKLIAAAQKSQHEFKVTAKTIEIMRGSFAGGEDAARALAERLVTQQEAIDAATKSTDKHSKAVKKMTDTYAEQVKRGDQYIARLAAENVELELKVNGQSDLIPLLKAENDLRDILGRELLPEEERRLKDILATRDKLNKKLAESEALTKASQEAAKEQERIWTHAAENIQDALADAIFSGKNLFQSLKDVALNIAKQIAAAMIFRPIIAPILGGVSGVGAIGGMGGGAGGMMSLGSNLSSIWSALNGPSTLGNTFAMSGIGQWLGLSAAPASGVGPIGLTGIGSTVAGIGNLLGAGGIGAGIGSIWGGLGLGNSMGSSIGGAIGGAIGSRRSVRQQSAARHVCADRHRP